MHSRSEYNEYLIENDLIINQFYSVDKMDNNN